MVDIKKGEYIRTKDGFIDKVIIDYAGKCNNPNCTEKHISCEIDYYCEEEIVKHSSNIIDLIEVGDYVNGSYVLSIETLKNKKRKIIIEYGCYEYGEKELTNEDIKSIVTEEQFKSVEYEV